MIILGLDPGTATTGYGVIQGYRTKKTVKHLKNGVISTSPKAPQAERLRTIERGLLKIFKEFKPNVVVIEKLFFFKNLKTALPVSQAVGVILLTAQKQKVKIYQFTPLEIKMVLTGYGRADKKEVQKQVKKILKLKEMPRPDDAADGLAAALCYCFKEQ